MEKITLRRLKKDDYNSLVDLLNNVFTIQNKTEMDFEAMFPRIFVKSDETMGWHMGAIHNGKLCGVAASYPITYRVGDFDLKASAAGNVAVDNSMRGQGIMQSILNRLDEEDKAAGFDFSYLHGDRFRYRNFGYERCGVEFYFNLSTKLMEPSKQSFRFVNLNSGDDSLIKKAFELSKQQNCGIMRTEEDFMPALNCHSRLPIAVIDNSGNVAGYFTSANDNRVINEICINNPQSFSDIMKCYMEENNILKMDIRMPAYSNLISTAHSVSDRYRIVQPANFKIFNFKRIVECFMTEKAKYSYMPDGVITINSHALGSWSIEKKNDTVCAQPYSGKAQYELPGYTVYPFLFGTFMPQTAIGKPEDEILLKTWFPLPLYCPDLT